MQLQHIEFPFTLLTPCFSGTALGKIDDHAEMRIPPIRGHVRYWHRELFGPENANQVWGSTNGNEGQGSRVALSFIGPVSAHHETPKPTLLPHKDNPNHRGPRAALAEGETFTLVLQRLVGCSEDDWDHAQRAIKLWLLLGGLGLRSNRAAGSVWPMGNWAPSNLEAVKDCLEKLGLTGWSVALIGLGKGKSSIELRETASDTIKGNTYRQIFGGINDRRPSPTKFKVIRLGADHGLLAAARADVIVGYDKVKRLTLLEAEALLLKQKPQPFRWQSLGPWQYLFL